VEINIWKNIHVPGFSSIAFTGEKKGDFLTENLTQIDEYQAFGQGLFCLSFGS